jgi:hypothetical protein
MRSSKKWKHSIRIAAAQLLPAGLEAAQGAALGEWLDRQGLVVAPRKERRRDVSGEEVERCVTVSGACSTGRESLGVARCLHGTAVIM